MYVGSSEVVNIKVRIKHAVIKAGMLVGDLSFLVPDFGSSVPESVSTRAGVLPCHITIEPYLARRT